MVSALHNLTAVILAGGFGTRVRHLLPDIPKPMAPVAGRPFVEWVVRFLMAKGIQRVIISTGYRAEVIEQHFRALELPGARVSCIREPRALGTAGGFLNAAQASEDRPEFWMVLNGDSLVFADPGQLLREMRSSALLGAIFGLSVPDASRYGSLSFDQDGKLTGFNEKRSGSGFINAGVYLLAARALELFPERLPLSFERDVFPAWIEQGMAVKVVPVDAPFLDIGTEETLGRAGEFIESNAAQFAV